MKKGIFLVALLFITMASFGQKIKVKKGKILVDKKPVANMNIDNSVYTITDLDNNETAFVLEYKRKQLSYGISDGWVEYSSPHSEFINTQNIVFGKTFQKSRNALASMLFKQGLISKDGLNEERIQQYFSKQRERKISERVQDAYQRKAVVDEFNAYLSKDSIIYKGGENGVRVGSVTKKGKYMKFRDVQDYVVASYDLEEGKLHYAPDGSKTSFKGSALEGVNELVFKGATFGRQKEEFLQKVKDDKREALQQKHDESGNVYWQPGYIVERDGTEHHGEVRIIFKDISADGALSVVATINQYGSIAKFRKNSNANSTKFKASDGVKVCTEEGTCYLGVPIDGELNLSTNKVSFSKIVEETDNYTLLNSPTLPNRHALLIKGQEKAFNLFKSSKKKLQKLFDEYLNCSSIKADNYETKTARGIQELLKDYSEKCK